MRDKTSSDKDEVEDIDFETEGDSIMEMLEELDAEGSLSDVLEEQGCLHEQLEKSKPQNHKGGAHMLACPCPRCSPRC